MTRTDTTGKTPDEIREMARASRRESIASFERSDTDGFLSQWASDIMSSVLYLEADIVENGGMAKFLALFDLDGNFVPAREIQTRYGTRWMVLDSDGKSTGEFLPYLPARRDTLAKRGFVEGFVLRPAYAGTAGSGRGLSGACSVHAVAIPETKPHEPPASVVTPDRWAD